MKIVFRVDASTRIGSGHVMRCLALADLLRGRGAHVIFICRQLPGDLSSFIEEKGFEVYRFLPQAVRFEDDQQTDARESQKAIEDISPDWLVVDHYVLDRRWEAQLRPYVDKIMVIDDLADRPHDCDLLLDQNFYEEFEIRYDGLIPEYCLTLLGPRYALLRTEFLEAKKKLKKGSGSLKHILIFFGGSDHTNETTKALDALHLLNRSDITADVVVGAGNLRKDKIRSICSRMLNTKYYCQTSKMAELVLGSDLALGAGGSATWERCFLGLPALTVVTAENQEAVTMAVEKTGAIQNMGAFRGVTSEALAQAIVDIGNDPCLLIRMGENALEIMGGNDYRGAAGVLSAMLN